MFDTIAIISSQEFKFKKTSKLIEYSELGGSNANKMGGLKKEA